MKNKIVNLMRSMKFGMFLLIVVSVFCVIGSVIPQNKDVMTYMTSYPNSYRWITALQFDHVFTTWYFGIIIGMLCLNLTLCSVVKGFKLIKNYKYQVTDKAIVKCNRDVKNEKKFEEYIKVNKYKVESADGKLIYYKNKFGVFGSVIVHFSFIVILVLGGVVLDLENVSDIPLYANQPYEFSENQFIKLNKFTYSNVDGKIDYQSDVVVYDTSTNAQVEGVVTVNYPVQMGEFKFYQQAYKMGGTIEVGVNGKFDKLSIQSGDFITLDGESGLALDTIYPDYIDDGDGNVQVLMPNAKSEYKNPIYQFVVVDKGTSSTKVMKIGDTMSLGGVDYVITAPEYYPIIRVKETNMIALDILMFDFLIIIWGLYVCFFTAPIYIIKEGSKYEVVAKKVEKDRIVRMIEGEE